MSKKTAHDLYDLMQIQIDLQREMLERLTTISTRSQRPGAGQEELSQLRMDMLRFVFNNYSGTFYSNQRQHQQHERDDTTATEAAAEAAAEAKPVVDFPTYKTPSRQQKGLFFADSSEDISADTEVEKVAPLINQDEEQQQQQPKRKKAHEPDEEPQPKKIFRASETDAQDGRPLSARTRFARYRREANMNNEAAKQTESPAPGRDRLKKVAKKVSKKKGGFPPRRHGFEIECLDADKRDIETTPEKAKEYAHLPFSPRVRILSLIATLLSEKDHKSLDIFELKVKSLHEKLKELAKDVHCHLMKELAQLYKGKEIKKVIEKRWITIPAVIQDKYTLMLEQKSKRELDLDIGRAQGMWCARVLLSNVTAMRQNNSKYVDRAIKGVEDHLAKCDDYCNTRDTPRGDAAPVNTTVKDTAAPARNTTTSTKKLVQLASPTLPRSTHTGTTGITRAAAKANVTNTVAAGSNHSTALLVEDLLDNSRAPPNILPNVVSVPSPPPASSSFENTYSVEQDKKDDDATLIDDVYSVDDGLDSDLYLTAASNMSEGSSSVFLPPMMPPMSFIPLVQYADNGVTANQQQKQTSGADRKGKMRAADYQQGNF